MRRVISPPVRGKQEGRDGRFAGVVPRCHEEFQEMEQAERGDEERDAPVGRLEGCAADEGQAEGQAEACAEEECAQRDSGEGLVPVWVVGWVCVWGAGTGSEGVGEEGWVPFVFWV